MKQACTLDNIQTINPSASMKETLIDDKTVLNGNHLEIRLASFSKQLDNQKNSSLPQKCSLVSVPLQKFKILHTKGTLMPVNTIPSVRVTSPISNSNECRFQVKPFTGTGLALQGKASKLLVNNFTVDNEKKMEEECDGQLISPSSRWLSQPRSYRGAKRDNPQRKVVRKISIPSFVDTTDGETSGMGSSVDEPIESSTESASEASSSFLQPKLSLRPLSTSPLALKKRRGGWPKGRKRKPELPGTKPPKAPLTAYVLFLNERRKFYKETHSQMPVVEVTKVLGAEWSSMTPEQKSVYVTRSEQDKRRYRSELQTFRQSHDYQILLRKKRMKNAMNRGQTTEESSDFTDEVDDDESLELYCKQCEQWFSSLHNRREHLYGKLHLQNLTGEYERERQAEAKRQASATSPTSLIGASAEVNPKQEETATDCVKEAEHDESVDPLLPNPEQHLSRRNSIGVTSTTEDDPDDEEEDDEEDREYDGEEEVTEEEGGSTEYWNSASDSERVTDAAEGVISKVLNREKEIRFLRGRYEKSRRHNSKVFASFLNLQARHKFLKEEQERLHQEEKCLLQEAKNLAKLSEIYEFNSGKIFDIKPGAIGPADQLPGQTGNLLDCETGISEITYDIDKILGPDNGTTSKLSDMNQNVTTGYTSEKLWYSGSSNSAISIPSSVSHNNVSEPLSPSQIILTDARTSCFTTSNISDVPVENFRIEVSDVSVPVQLNAKFSIVGDRSISKGDGKNSTVKSVPLNETSSNSLGNLCSSVDTQFDFNLALTEGKSNDSRTLPARSKRKLNPPLQVDSEKVHELQNIRKFNGQFDHSYSKPGYPPIPRRKKMPNTIVKTIKNETSNDSSIFYTPDSSPNSQPTNASQVSKDLGTLPIFSGHNQRKNECIPFLSYKDLITNNNPSEISRGDAKHIPVTPLKGIENNLVEERYEPLFKVCQEDNSTFDLRHSNSNFLIYENSEDGSSENVIVFAEGNISSDSPEFKYFDVNLLQGDVESLGVVCEFSEGDVESLGGVCELSEGDVESLGGCELPEDAVESLGNCELPEGVVESLGGCGLSGLQWDDIPFIEGMNRQHLNSLPILDNIFEEDYLPNFSYESSI